MLTEHQHSHQHLASLSLSAFALKKHNSASIPLHINVIFVRMHVSLLRRGYVHPDVSDPIVQNVLLYILVRDEQKSHIDD